MNDEGFREIQLNGKQLIFLFMAVTVVLVVTFLFGVLVGRGVREGRSAPDCEQRHRIRSRPRRRRQSRQARRPPPAGARQRRAPPAEELSYADRLLRDSAPRRDAETRGTALLPHRSFRSRCLRRRRFRQSASAGSGAEAARTGTAAPAAAPSDRTPTTAASGSQNAPVTPAPAPATAAKASDPSGPGFAVQVAAYRDRRDADTLAKQLAAKGYPAFVMDPVKGTSTALFRVRVGKYKTLKDAEAVESRLQTSEQLTNAWIAR